MEVTEQPTGIKIEGSIINKEFETPIVETPVTPIETPVETPVTPIETPAETPTVTAFDTKWKETFGDVAPDVVKEKYSKYDSILPNTSN